MPQHFQFAQTFYDAIKSGNVFLSWSANTNFGYGDIGIRFYPPLAHYCLAFTQLFTSDWQTSTWLNIYFWMLLGSIGSYLYAREWLSTQNSLWVGILYAIAPYHLWQIYQFFLYSEFVGAAILPFCFLYLTRISRNGNLKDALKLGFVSAILILSHIPTTIISVACLGIYTIFIFDWKKLKNSFRKILLSSFIALGLTAFYWVRLVTELNLVNHSSPRFASGLYGYQQYLFPMFFNNSADIYLIKQLWLKDIVSILTMLLILPLGIHIFLKFKELKNKKELLALFITGSFALFMSSSLSSFFWANISFLQKIQFPFRWLSVATILGVLGFVLFFKSLTLESFQTIKNYTLISFFVILGLFNITQIILPAGLLTNEDFSERIKGLRDSESFDCWWTVWSDKKAFETKEKVLASNRTVNITRWETEKREFEVEQGHETTARIATFFYPHWQATVNGKKIEVGLNKDGTISIPLPAHSSKITLEFREPFHIQLANIFSTIVWIILLLTLFVFGIKNYRHGLKLEVIG